MMRTLESSTAQTTRAEAIELLRQYRAGLKGRFDDNLAAVRHFRSNASASGQYSLALAEETSDALSAQIARIDRTLAHL